MARYASDVSRPLVRWPGKAAGTWRKRSGPETRKAAAWLRRARALEWEQASEPEKEAAVTLMRLLA